MTILSQTVRSDLVASDKASVIDVRPLWLMSPLDGLSDLRQCCARLWRVRMAHP